MKRNFHTFLLAIFVLTIIHSCGPYSKLYRSDNTDRNYNRILSDSTYNTLKLFLVKTTSKKLNDTLLIKYDYNNETCWDLLDQKVDDYILGFVTRHKERLQKVEKTRPNVSAFNFREPGNNLNKIIQLNNLIIIDSSKQLFNLIFSERCTCGSSIIVMPDKRFVFLRSDSHSELLDLSKEQIDEILNKK